jgi:hypothetical protein
MAETDNSFNATGPTVVAFETTSLPTPSQEIGASVTGTRGGVYGQSMTPADDRDRRVMPPGTGVYGRGLSHGVYGISGGVDDHLALAPDTEIDDAPDFGSSPAVPIGVVGVSDAGPGVFGDSGILRADLMAADPGIPSLQDNSIVFFNEVDTAHRSDAGVVGVSRAGVGVLGVSFTGATKRVAGQDPPSAGVTDALNGLREPPGVLGLSVRGEGVHGASTRDRGGVFASARESQLNPGAGPPVAQIQLVPLSLPLGEQRLPVPAPGWRPVDLPRDGRGGDLLVVRVLDPFSPDRNPSCSLWFCSRGADPARGTPAVWQVVPLGDAFEGRA